MSSITVLIPALNEEQAIAKVVRDTPSLVDRVIVIDNGSTDATTEKARGVGAEVVYEPKRGYGKALLAGIKELKDTDIVVFIDGDYSQQPEEIPKLVHPIMAGEADLVQGSRIKGKMEEGAMPPHAKFANQVFSRLISALYNVKLTDLSPFRAITHDALASLAMKDEGYGWIMEMTLKALKRGYKVKEMPISYRRGIGRSKISGSSSESIKAAAKLTYTFLKYSLMRK